MKKNIKSGAWNIKLCPVWSSVENKSDGKMYGLLLESVQYYIIQDVGETMWNKILEHAGFKNLVFTTHSTYKDEIMTLLAESCCHVTKTKDFNQWMTFFGTCFVEFCTSYGYDKLLRLTGRHYRDFLHGIDNIHEVIRFSYPRLQSPAFLVLTEDSEGCVLLYQSKRRGFKYYVIGQLQQIARRFYDVSVNITVIEEEFIDRKCHVKFRLDFDNSAYKPKICDAIISGNSNFSSITGDTFLKVFPFCIVFNSELDIRMVGSSMMALLKEDTLIGSLLGEKFNIRRPLIPCVWSKILQFSRVIFELEYLFDNSVTDDPDTELITDTNQESGSRSRVLLRGQMKYLDDWKMIAFLCTPLLNNLQDLRKAGLFINDLNSFDMSRDMVMAGWQHASQLERSIEDQRHNSEKITDNMTKFEEWKQKSDNLLYAMIPKSVASKLKSGQDPVSTCEVFDNVTIMFNYMVGFGDVCSAASPMEIVKIINTVFSVFDHITDRYNVFKVETLGDAVYMVAGGVPDRSPDNALSVAGLALELQSHAKTLTEPWNQAYKLNTRIGMHTGSVVGGVVGRRMPQYCLFGDTVNTASRMQTYSQPGRIHISEPCQECLKGSHFVTILRGTVNVKGKGEMRTYWLAGREGEEQTKLFQEKIREERNQSVRKYSSYENAMDLHAMHASTSFAHMPANFGSTKSTSNVSLARLQPDIEVPEDQLSPGNRSPNRQGSPRSSFVKPRGKTSESTSEIQAKFSIFEESSIDMESEDEESNEVKGDIKEPCSHKNMEVNIPQKKENITDNNEPVLSEVTESRHTDGEKHYGLKLGKFKLSLPKLSHLSMFNFSNHKTNTPEALNGFTVQDHDLHDKDKEPIGNNDDLRHKPSSSPSKTDLDKYNTTDDSAKENIAYSERILLTDHFDNLNRENKPLQELNSVISEPKEDCKSIDLTHESSYTTNKTSEIRKTSDIAKHERHCDKSNDSYFCANNYLPQEMKSAKEKRLLTSESGHYPKSNSTEGRLNICPIKAKENQKSEICSKSEPLISEKRCPYDLRKSHTDKYITQSNQQSISKCFSHQGFVDTEVKRKIQIHSESNDKFRGNTALLNKSNDNFNLPTMQSYATNKPVTPVIEMDKLEVLEKGIKLAWGLEKADDKKTDTHIQTTDIDEGNTGDTNAVVNGQIDHNDNPVLIQSQSIVNFQLSDDES